MINILFRIFAVALLLVIVLAKDVNIPKFVKQPLIQLYLALCVILILLLFDNMTGFILGLCLLVMYFKYYNYELQNKNKNNKNDRTSGSDIKDVKDLNHSNSNHSNNSSNNMGLNKSNLTQRCPLDNYNEKFSQNSQITKKQDDIEQKHYGQIEYTTQEQLLAAQNNVYDLQNYNKEVLGIEKGIYDEKVYGPQGLNSTNVHFRGNDDSLFTLGSLHFAILENE